MMRPATSARWTCILLCVVTSSIIATSGERILLLPYAFHSHIRQLLMIGEGLVDEGHEVYVGIPKSLPGLNHYQHGKVKLLTNESPRGDVYTLSPEETKVFMLQLIHLDSASFWRKNIPETLYMCFNFLEDEVHYQTIKELKFDLAIVDIFAMNRCKLLLPYNLGIPYIGVTTLYEPWLLRTPSLPSFVPNNLYGYQFSPRMNFWERLDNLWRQVDWTAFPQINFLDDVHFKPYFQHGKMVKTLDELTGKCLLYLIDVEHAIDYPRPQMTNEISIGGLTTKPAKPLPEDLENFMQSSTNGVILMTFGSFGLGLEPQAEKEFVLALQQIKYSVLWKYVEEPDGLPANVKVVQWLPQNDILGHPKTRLFVTHCGNNGQMEALFHGVPMIGFPLFGDQHYNCERLHYHHIGVCLQRKEFKAHKLVNAVNEVLGKSSYKSNIVHLSKLFKDRPMTPLQTALYWVNHVIKYGGKHMHSHALDLPWYEYLMLDILAFIFAGFSLMLLCILCFCHFLIKYTARKDQTHAKKE